MIRLTRQDFSALDDQLLVICTGRALMRRHRRARGLAAAYVQSIRRAVWLSVQAAHSGASNHYRFSCYSPLGRSNCDITIEYVPLRLDLRARILSGHSLTQRTDTAICFWPWGPRKSA